MRTLNVALVSLGQQKQPIDMALLCQWRSRVVSIHHAAAIAYTPNAIGNAWQYPDDQLRNLVKPVEGADITVAIVSAPIERNFYSRRLGNNVVVFSIHEMAHILNAANFQLEHFILRNIYQIAIYFHALNGSVPDSNSMSWSHHDIRRCLFDMNSQKTDVLYSMHQPKLCDACRARIGQHQVDPDLLHALDAELPRLRRKLFFQIVDWVKLHPIYSLLLTAAFSIALNIIASIIFEKAKRAWLWLG